MPRHFRPVGGFKVKHLDSIRIDDDGTSHEVFKNGMTKAVGHVNHLNQFKSTWSIPELENMIRGGMMEEIKPAEPAAPPIPAPQEPLPAETSNA